MAHFGLKPYSEQHLAYRKAKRLVGGAVAALALSAGFSSSAEAVTKGTICKTSPPGEPWYMTVTADTEITVPYWTAISSGIYNYETGQSVSTPWKLIPPGTSVADAQSFPIAKGSGWWAGFVQVTTWNGTSWGSVGITFIPVIEGNGGEWWCAY
jgi:hypothetical protein